MTDRTEVASAAGLTSAEAAERLERYGANAVPGAAPRGVGALLGKFWGVIPWMLEFALVIDLVVGRWVEAGVIAVLLVFNALLAFSQESRAQQALRLLRERLTVNARVRRDGRWQVIPADQIVPEDLLHLRAGDIVPADLFLTDGQLELDQSQLTGESLPVGHRARDTVYAGSLVSRGEATGLVTATGTGTYFGKTAELVRHAEAPRRLEVLIVKVAGYLGAVVIILAVIAIATMIARGTPWSQMLPFGAMLLVTSVPVALPMMFTMSAALGARGLAQSGILVTRLSAIEDAASMDVLCLDKTGTVTENHLTVGELAPLTPTTSDDLLRLAAAASDEATQDPIDLAILQTARERGVIADPAQRVGFIPFDPSTKRSEASMRRGDQTVRVVKGEPFTIAELAHASWSLVAPGVQRLSADGSRVLAVATGTESDLDLVGLIALGDPLRPESATLIAELRERGVRVLLVTGDGEATARAVAAKAGITGEVAPAGAIREALDPATLAGLGIYPGVFPQDKFLLVQRLQQAGHVVGMTGDGVNDAPALRQADVGIAVANATDVAKAAASLVLTRPGLGEIVMATDGSRRIFQRMQNFVLTMISMKLSTPIFFALGVILAGRFVVTPLQIVILMLLGNFVTMSVSMDRVAPSPKPDRWILRPMMAAGTAVAFLSLLLNGAIFWLASNVLDLDVAQSQTLLFFWLVISAGQAVLYVTRGRGFFWEPPYPGRWHLLATLLDIGVVTLMATQGWLMASISPALVAGTLALALAFLLIADVLKITLRGRATDPADGMLPSAERPNSSS
jgi:H+-transporting ATPase